VPPPPELAQVEPCFYDHCVGQYRKTLLFGLIRLGPTLGVSHVADDCGEHLIGCVPGLVGRNPAELFPTGKGAFILEPGSVATDLGLTFVRDSKDRVKRVRVRWNGHTFTIQRISDEPLKLTESNNQN
jgi:hypothetical protein